MDVSPERKSTVRICSHSHCSLEDSPQIDSAVRSALLPELEATSESSTDGLHVPALVPSSFPGHGLSAPDDATITTHTLRSSQLNTIQKHLLRGDRRAAYQYAADQSLWAHAMVIASSVDKEAWKEVVTDFLRSELSPKDASGSALHASDSKGASSNGREPLKVAYSLFAGQGPASSMSCCTHNGSRYSYHMSSPRVAPAEAFGIHVYLADSTTGTCDCDPHVRQFPTACAHYDITQGYSREMDGDRSHDPWQHYDDRVIPCSDRLGRPIGRKQLDRGRAYMVSSVSFTVSARPNP